MDSVIFHITNYGLIFPNKPEKLVIINHYEKKIFVMF